MHILYRCRCQYTAQGHWIEEKQLYHGYCVYCHTQAHITININYDIPEDQLIKYPTGNPDEVDTTKPQLKE